jgi:hypothetical protein
MTEAIELYKKDGSSTGVFYCSECGVLHRTEENAKYCHGVRTCECGKPAEAYRTTCAECTTKQFNEESERRERARFEKATKVPASEYKGEWVFSEDHDRFFDSVESLMEHIEDDSEEGEAVPEYVWACNNIGVRKATLQDITESIVENMWEDAEEGDLNGIAELEAAINAFNEANKTVNLWEADYSLAVLIENSKAEVE